MDADLTALLARLGLGRLEETLVEEAITELPLLTSMGAEMLRENLTEIGVDKADIAVLAAELFPPAAAAAADGTAADSSSAASAEGADAPRGGGALAPRPGNGAGPAAEAASAAAAAGMTHDEETAHEMAEWLLKPYLVTDLADLKKKVMRLTAQGNAYLADGQYANAAATYTHALALEAPNSRANAALYYNRSAAQHKLGRPWLAVRDATLAAEADPRRSAPAWWRVAQLSLATGDVPTAQDAAARGLRAQPGCAPLKIIQAAIAANAAGI